jgi:hypothetical protein
MWSRGTLGCPVCFETRYVWEGIHRECGARSFTSLMMNLIYLRLMAQAIESHSMHAVLFESGHDYFAHPRTDALAYLNLDPKNPDAGALNLLAQHSAGVGLPVVTRSHHEYLCQFAEFHFDNSPGNASLRPGSRGFILV